MDTRKTLTEQLHDLRIAYEKETDAKKQAYAARLKKIEEQIAEVKGRDYSAPYKTKYRQALTAVETPISKIEKIEGATHGLKNTLANFIKENAIHNEKGLRQGCVEEVFEWILTTMADVAERLGKAESMSDFATILSQYATVIVTARDVNKNADAYLKSSGLPEQERARDLKLLTEQ